MCRARPGPTTARGGGVIPQTIDACHPCARQRIRATGRDMQATPDGSAATRAAEASTGGTLPADPALLAQVLDRLAAPGQRLLIGLAGSPGSGKSTLTEAVVAALAHRRATAIPMDGFHLANATLRET